MHKIFCCNRETGCKKKRFNENEEDDNDFSLIKALDVSDEMMRAAIQKTVFENLQCLDDDDKQLMRQLYNEVLRQLNHARGT